jgi:hypothetical protein
VSYPDPYRPQQPPPGPYPPAPPGPYGYPPNGGYPPAQPYGYQQPYGHQQPYGYPQQPPYNPQLAAERDDGNSKGWRFLDNATYFFTETAGRGLGRTARDRVKARLIIAGFALAAFVLIMLIAVLL